jgi:RNA polymerase sigma factor (TIGR02999 family)
VHEVYIRLARLDRVAVVSRTHFLALAARLMRQILVDQARRNQADKRGGGVTLVGLETGSPSTRDNVVDVIAVDEALSRLAALDVQQSRIVELRFFGGLTAHETAETLGVSVATVDRDWTMAKAWLRSQLT